MKIHLLIFLALLWRISADCIDDCPAAFRGKLVCAYDSGCYLNMEYCSMLAFNCARYAQRRQMFLFVAEGACGNESHEKCETIDT